MFTNLLDYFVLAILGLSVIGILATLIGFKLLTDELPLDITHVLINITDDETCIF